MIADSSSSPLCYARRQGKKKKRPQASRIKLEDGDDEAATTTTTDAMEVDTSTPVIHTRRRAEERDNLVDDDELAASLAKARRAKAKKAANKMTPQQIAENLAAQRKAEEAESRREGNHSAGQPSGTVGDSENSAGEANGLTFDATSEFIQMISQRPNTEEEESRRPTEDARPREETAAGTSVVKSEPQDEGDQTLAAAGMDADALLSREGHDIKEEDQEDEEMELGEELDGSDEDIEDHEGDLGAIGTSAEASISSGLSGTLNLLRSQGLIQGSTPEQLKREAAQKSYDAWKARHMAEEALKEEERRMSKLQGTAKDQSTREYENKLRELEEAKRAESRFKDYKPDVDIKYHDENGRQLNNHEAWKLLSHTFHGKMPGKQKQMKYRKKVEEERKKEKLLAGDSNDLSKNFQKRQQRQGQAHMVLSVGVKGNAPTDFASDQQSLLGPNLIHQRMAAKDNAKKSQKGKKKDTQDTTASPSPAPVSMLPAPLPKIITSSNGHERSPSVSTPGVASVAASASPLLSQAAPQPPRMKPAFAPIASSNNNSGSSSPAVPTTATGTGVSGGRIQIGLQYQ